MTPQEAWAKHRHHIEAALEYAGGTHLIEDVQAEIEAGEAWFVWSDNSAMVVQLHEFPRLKVASYWLAGGDLAELLDLTPSIEAWAKAQGCTKIYEAGRPGWTKALKPLGYAPLHTVVWKDL